jgi:hypothetical protein
MCGKRRKKNKHRKAAGAAKVVAFAQDTQDNIGVLVF